MSLKIKTLKFKNLKFFSFYSSVEHSTYNYQVSRLHLTDCRKKSIKKLIFGELSSKFVQLYVFSKFRNAISLARNNAFFVTKRVPGSYHSALSEI